MSKNTKLDDVTTDVVETSQVNTAEVLAKLVKRDDGYHVIDHDGTEGPVCDKRTSDGYIILTPNAANRKNVNEKKAKAFFAEHPDGYIALTHKATRKLGEVSRNTMPNAKLISHLPEELQAEYKAIIDKAIAAREADRKKPMSEEDKLRAKIAKFQAQIAKLTEQA